MCLLTGPRETFFSCANFRPGLIIIDLLWRGGGEQGVAGGTYYRNITNHNPQWLKKSARGNCFPGDPKYFQAGISSSISSSSCINGSCGSKRIKVVVVVVIV